MSPSGSPRAGARRGTSWAVGEYSSSESQLSASLDRRLYDTFILFLTLAGLASACAGSGSPQPASPPRPVVGVEQAAATITPEDMYDRVEYLGERRAGRPGHAEPGARDGGDLDRR